MTQYLFLLKGTNSLLDYVEHHWGSVQKYYEKRDLNCLNSVTTLYTFFREKVAPAAMGDTAAGIYLVGEVAAIYPSIYYPIALFFASGSGSFIMADSIYNAHCAFTYYTAMKYGLFV